MQLTIAGIGPGSEDGMTLAARRALEQAELIVGYDLYVDLVKQFLPDKTYYSTPMRSERERVAYAVRQAAAGTETVLICSGDPGIYGMASLALDTAQKMDEQTAPDIVILPGVTAALSAAALAGSPFTCDFAVISLSDLMVPWSLIEQRLDAAARGDFAIALYNPGSRKRTRHLAEACRILSRYRAGDTVCAIVENIGRTEERCRLLTLDELADTAVGMTTTVLIGSSFTGIMNGRMVTPRGYRDEYDCDEAGTAAPVQENSQGETGTSPDVGEAIEAVAVPEPTAGNCVWDRTRGTAEDGAMPEADAESFAEKEVRGSILLFGGTAEGRQLTETALKEGFRVTVSVVSEYGEEVLEPLLDAECGEAAGTECRESFCTAGTERRDSICAAGTEHRGSTSPAQPAQSAIQPETSANLRVLRGKMPPEKIRALLQSGAFCCVIDATHPYAAQITDSIRRASEAASVPYYRVLRAISDPWKTGQEAGVNGIGQPAGQAAQGEPAAVSQNRNGQHGDILSFPTMEQIIDYLNTCEGRVFFSTGSAGAPEYARLKNAAERAVIRILPSEEAIRLCREAGFRGKNLLCMQGPFDQAMNEACFRFAKADYLVTKSSGAPGGFEDKIRAARALDMSIIVLEPPVQTEGISLEQMTERLRKWKKQ